MENDSKKGEKGLMNIITFEEFRSIMLCDITNNHSCIEIEFCVDNYKDYQCSWLGKMFDSKSEKSIYWFGLTEDGSQAYDYETFDQFSNAKVFYNKSIREIWDLVTILSIDACDIEERLPFYLELK